MISGSIDDDLICGSEHFLPRSDTGTFCSEQSFCKTKSAYLASKRYDIRHTSYLITLLIGQVGQIRQVKRTCDEAAIGR